MNTISKDFFKGKAGHVLAAVLLLLACFATFSNSLHNNFMIDDHGLIVGNPEVSNLKYFQLNFFRENLQPSTKVYYRPIPHVLIMFNSLWFGKDTFGYHLVNLAFFYAACFVIYAFCFMLFGNWKLALLTGLFFCVHPVNGMLVNYITATGYSVMILSLLLGLMSALWAMKKKGAGLYTALSLFWFTIALLSHEVVIIFPLYLAAILFFIKKCDIREIWRRCLPSTVLVVLYFIFRIRYASLKDSIIDHIPTFSVSFASYFATFFKLVLWYFSKLLFFEDIVLIWASPLVQTNLFLWCVGFAAVILGCLAMIFLVWKKDIRSFALSWVMIGFIPVTMGCLFQPALGLMIEPHWLFFSTIGFFLLLSYSIDTAEKKVGRNITVVVIMLLLTTYIWSSRQYNVLWGNEKKYCQRWLELVPQNINGIFILANAHMRDKEFPRAREIFGQLLKQYSTDWKIYNNLGLMDYEEGKYADAIANFQLAIKNNPNFPVIYSNLGSALIKSGDTEQAEAVLLKAVSEDELLIESRLNLADLYRVQKKIPEAIRLFEESLAIDPKDERGIYGLIEPYFLIGNKAKAFAMGKELLAVSRDAEKLTNAGSLFAAQGYTDICLALYSKALSVDPKHKEAYLEIGKLYGNLNQFNRAISFWMEGAKVDPTDGRFQDLINQAQAFKKLGNTDK